MKSEIVIQFGGRDVKESDIIKSAEEAWKNAGNKIADIKSVKLYTQPENALVYYVINDEFKGNFGI